MITPASLYLRAKARYYEEVAWQSDNLPDDARGVSIVYDTKGYVILQNRAGVLAVLEYSFWCDDVMLLKLCYQRKNNGEPV